MMLHFIVLLKCIVCFNFIVGDYTESENVRIVELSADLCTNITLPCSIHGKESAIEWKKPGKSSKHQVLENGSLFLYSLQKNDSGTYNCSVTHNDEDTVVLQIRLNVRTPPAALENVTVIPSTVLALIRWTLKDDGGYPVNITVRYREANQAEWDYVKPTLISLIHTQAEIYKLNPNTTYLFQVWATNPLGIGEKTNVTARTSHNNQEIELARHLLEGAETFDARIWLVAVAVVMTTLIVLTIGTWCITYRDCHVPLLCLQKNRQTGYENDPERIELIPNVILNPGFFEEAIPSSQRVTFNEDEKADLAEEEEEDVTAMYFACLNGAKAIDV